MSTDYGNYSKQLASAREEFSNSNQKLKKIYDDSLENINNTHEKREKDNQLLNEERRKVLIDQNQQDLVSLNQKSNDSLNIKQKEFIDNLRENNNEFGIERKIIKEKMEDKLSRAKDAFTRSLSQLTDSNQVQSKEKDKNFAHSLSVTRNTAEQKIRDMEKNNGENFSDYRKDVEEKKKETNTRNILDQSELSRKIRNEADKKAEYFTSKINEITENNKLESTKVSEKNEKETLRHKQENSEKLAQVEAKNKQYNLETINDFQNSLKVQEEQSKENLVNMKNKNLDEVLLKKKENELFVAKNINGKENIDQKENVKNNYERRLDSLKKQMSEQAISFSRISAIANRDALDKLKTQENNSKDIAAENSLNHHEEVGFLKRQSTDLSDKNNLENHELISQLEKDNELKFDSAQKLSNENRSHKQVMHEKEKVQIADINLKNIERIKSEASQERTKLKTNAIKELSDNTFEVKKSYQKKFDKTLEGYQQKFEAQDKLLEQITEGSNDKLHDIQARSEKNMEALTTRNKHERETEKNELLGHFVELKDSYESRFKSLKRDFDKELGRTRKENNILVTSIAKKNNEEVKNLMESYEREIRRANEDLRKEKEKNFKANSIEKENLIARYETKIEEMKVAYDSEKIKFSENKRHERL